MFGFQMRMETLTDLQSDFSKGNSLAQPSVKSCQLEKGKKAVLFLWCAKSFGKQLNEYKKSLGKQMNSK